MGRVSDTRFRTREAASRIVAAGRRPHELTVDLIYAEIRQGSRTTINDELKLWKDEQTKVDALGEALPAPVASAMLAAWTVAVEYGEKAFDRRRDEVEAELAVAADRTAAAEAAQTSLRTEIATLKTQQEAGRAELATVRQALRTTCEQRDAAAQQAALAEEQLAAQHLQAQQQIEAIRHESEQRLQQLREAMAEKESALRADVARATERLEGVQRHVLLQVNEAREAQKRAEDQSAKAVQRTERLSAELDPLRTQVTALAAQLPRAMQDQATAQAEARQLQAERDETKLLLANTTGRLEAATQQVGELTAKLNALTALQVRGKLPRRAQRAGATPSADEVPKAQDKP
ncbi:DNA-binding protein [Xylophilus sp. GW821-FHT01B05]